MRKIFLIFIAALFIVTTLHAEKDDKKENTKPIKILTGTLTHGIERSAPSVYAILDLDSEVIEVNYYGLLDGCIYIIDYDNNLIDTVDICSTSGNIVIPSPQIAGNYHLVILCDNYYGEGVFKIQ